MIGDVREPHQFDWDRVRDRNGQVRSTRGSTRGPAGRVIYGRGSGDLEASDEFRSGTSGRQCDTDNSPHRGVGADAVRGIMREPGSAATPRHEITTPRRSARDRHAGRSTNVMATSALLPRRGSHRANDRIADPLQVWLPLGNWNGKFAGVGTAAGRDHSTGLCDQLRRGYATARPTPDMRPPGHDAARFASTNRNS